LGEFWRPVKYLIIDEYSMISRELLARLSKILNIVFKHLKGEDFDVPCSLYFPTSQHDTVQQNAGSELYQQFSTVVILKSQVRIQDAGWQEVLRQARHGKCSEADLQILQQLWTDAVLVTPRNAVKSKWNTAAARRHCQRTHQQLMIFPAEDTKKGRAVLSVEERLALTKRRFDAKARQVDRSQLEHEILLAEGMKVMLVTNVQTDFDMANGSRGVVQQIFWIPESQKETINAMKERFAFHPHVFW
ncbi:hypothetical protein M378DRAFT_74627, partial [Amanita muscaria Koide BX008]